MTMRQPLFYRTSILVILYLAFATSSALAASPAGQSTKSYFPEPIYVALQDSDAVELLPEGTVWRGFPQAHYVDVSADGKTMIVSGFGTGQVYVASATTGKKLGTLKIGQVVQGVKIDPSGQLALAVDASGNSVKVIDLKTVKVIKTIPVGKNPHNAVFSRDGRLAYITVQGANRVAVLDMLTLKMLREIPVAELHGPHNLKLSRDQHEIWIRNHPNPSQDGHVVLLDLRTRRVVESIEVGPFHGGVDRVGHSDILATNIGGDTVDVIDPNALGVVKRIKVGAGPHGVRMSPDGHWAYISSTIANEVDVIDMHSLSVVDRIKTHGSYPFWIAIKGNS
jgi:YVTN family beta-propeller protein